MLRTRVRHRLIVLSATASTACGGTNRGSAPSETWDDPVPVAGCEQLDSEPCRIDEAGCPERLAELAACVFGGPDGEAVMLPIREVDEAQLRGNLELRRPSPRGLRDGEERWLHAWEQLGLVDLDVLTEQNLAGPGLQRVTAFYDAREREIEVFRPEDTTEDPIHESVAFVHELIHALQDRAHDLTRMWDEQGRSTDAQWGLNSLIEGEASFHEARVRAAMLGLDLDAPALSTTFEQWRTTAEQSIFEAPVPLIAGHDRPVYMYGTEFCYAEWLDHGFEAMRALFDTPPNSLYLAFARIHGEASGASDVFQFSEPEPPDSTHSVYDWDSLGPWGIYLATGGTNTDLALGWRGDQLSAFELSNGDTGVRWEFEVASSEIAARLAERLNQLPVLGTTVEGTRVVVGAAPDHYPWLLEPTGR